jgi:hypothetical protein
MKAALFLYIMLCGLSPWYQFLEKPVASICMVEEHESTMKLEAVGFFETLVCIYRFSQRHVLEDENFCLLFSSEYSLDTFRS